MTKTLFARATSLVVVAFFIPLLVTNAAAKTPGLPGYVTFPPDMNTPAAPSYESYGEALFYPHDAQSPVDQRGKHWQTSFSMKNAPAGTEAKTVWAHFKPTFLKNGWVAMGEYDNNPYSATLHYQKGTTDAWAIVSIFSSDDIRLELIEIGGPSATLSLTAPGAKPERVSPTRGDFPYLTPLAGSKFTGGSKDNEPMSVNLPGSDEVELVGTGSITKSYDDEGLSNLEFAKLYHDAFVKAGWTIVSLSQSMTGADASITVHYAKNGRDIWANLHATPGTYTIRVADAGAKDLGAQLAASCHVALYGVLFDFNKANLKPDSDPVLGAVLALLQKNASLSVEIQGHTDNVGDDAYNQKLSEARAHSVVAWLVQHGIAANRLTATGYGKTRPVASNDTDEGRARNRRVEIAKPGCQAK